MTPAARGSGSSPGGPTLGELDGTRKKETVMMMRYGVPRVAPRHVRPAFGLAVFAALAAQAAGRDVRAEAPSRPNVLFIAVDDLNDWTGFLGGHPATRTPNMDRLARRGVAFTRAYCSAPACNPSRTSLMTGVRPSTSGVYHNDQPWRPVLPDAVTLPQHLRAAGYHVVGGGKIFHN